MRGERPTDRPSKSVDNGLPRQQAALPGRGRPRPHRSRLLELSRRPSGRDLDVKSAIKQEVAIACLLLPVSFFIARDVWTWVALVGSLLFVLSIEFLNTAIERLCNHSQPERHEAIRITKDLASAGVFFALALGALIWIAALWCRFAH